MKEEWRPVKGFEDYYYISSTGRLKALARPDTMPHNGGVLHYIRKERIMSPAVDDKGYSQVRLGFGNNRKYIRIHRLVSEAFIPNPDRLPVVNHIDGNPRNNHYSNLEWCTQSHNVRHSYTIGRHKPANRGYKFDKLQYRVIVECRAAGMKLVDICRYFKISTNGVYHIERNKERLLA